MSSLPRFALRRFTAIRRFSTTTPPGHNHPICPACQTKRGGFGKWFGKWFNPIHHPDNCIILASFLFSGVLVVPAIMMDRERGWPGHKKLYKELIEKLSKA